MNHRYESYVSQIQPLNSPFLSLRSRVAGHGGDAPACGSAPALAGHDQGSCCRVLTPKLRDAQGFGATLCGVETHWRRLVDLVGDLNIINSQ